MLKTSEHSTDNIWEGGNQNQCWPQEEMLEGQESGQIFQRTDQLEG